VKRPGTRQAVTELLQHAARQTLAQKQPRRLGMKVAA
jgi:hypothetical protein